MVAKLLWLLLIALLVAIIATIILRSLHKGQDSIKELSFKNQKLEKKQLSLKEVQSMAHLGPVVWYFADHTVLLDEQFRSLVPGNNEGRVPIAAFVELAHPDDRERLNQMIAEITDTDIVYAWVDVRLGSSEHGFRSFHLYGNVKRKADGSAERFDGIMQDITDLKQ